MTSSEAFRLSPQQRRAWLLQPDGVADLARAAVSLTGELDPDRLRTAVERVVERHEILRTRFSRRPGFRVPFQVVDPHAGFSWDDAPAPEAGAPGPDLDAFLRGRRPPVVDLERGSSLAVELVRWSAGDHLLLFTLPALCADSAALDHLVAEVAEAYGLGGQPSPDPGLVQYADYSEWQNELIETDDESARAARAYWSGRELPAAAMPGLPFELPRGGAPAGRRELSTLLLPPDLAARATRTAGSLGASPAELWLACWLTLLGRRTGGAEAAAAVRFDGRGHEELRRAVGLFACWLPIAVPFDGDLRFRDLLAQVVKAGREADELQRFFSWESEGPRARTAAAFGFELDVQPEARTAAGVTFTLRHREAASERCGLLLSCTLADGALAARLSYDAGRYEERDVERLAGELRALCEQAAERPDEPVGRLDLLTGGERRRLLIELNDTRVDFGPPRSRARVDRGRGRERSGACGGGL